ncbi:MAG TPA: phosphatase PAP2-related protein [Cyclobacteriaceae bacterium]|nr:phosphatase PAP2-related protein [Cyclobacteriaceae bacterium]
MIKSVINNWKQAIGSRTFVVQLSVTMFLLLLLALLIGRFFAYVQSVKGTLLNDPLLAMLPAEDMSMIIFPLIYGAIAIGLIHLSVFPDRMLRAAQAYVLLTLMRMLTLFLFPLEPDRSIVVLNDAFVDLLFYDNRLITKDLFFSGHVSVIVMLAMASKNFFIKRILGTIASIVGLSLLIQHAHYSIDILAAPVFAWVSVRIAEKIPQATPVG